jgi:uncharacterized lipoprotein YmbA
MSRRSSCTLALSGLFLVGCIGFGSSEQSRFYTLTSLEEASTTATQESSVCVYIAVVELPRHLGSPEIVTRASDNEIVLANFDRWAEPLDKGTADTLKNNLSVLLGSDRVFRYPWERSSPIDFAVTVAVHRFDSADEEVVLQATWKLSRKDLDDTVAIRRAEFRKAVEGSGYGAIVRAMSAALADLSREIAAEITAQ